MQAQSQEHHSIDCLLGERHRERGHVYLTVFRERTRKGHRQSEQYWNCSKATLGKLLRDWVECVCFFSPLNSASSWNSDLESAEASRIYITLSHKGFQTILCYHILLSVSVKRIRGAYKVLPYTDHLLNEKVSSVPVLMFT